MAKDRLPALQTRAWRRRSTMFFSNSNVSSEGALDFGYRLLMEYEYLNDFLNDASALRKDICWLNDRVQDVRKVQSKILSAPVIDQRLLQELDSLIDSIKKMGRKISEKLKEFEIEIQRSRQENPTSAEPRIRQMQYETLSRNFWDVMVECNTIQVDHRERCKQRFKRQLEIAGHETSDDQLEEMLEQDNPAIFTRDIDLKGTTQAKNMLADIEARHKDIQNLERSITDLHAMFLDMAVLVDSQGAIIDRIDYNVEKAVDFVAQATRHTKKAMVFKERLRWKRIALISVILIILIIIIGSVAGSLSRKT